MNNYTFLSCDCFSDFCNTFEYVINKTIDIKNIVPGLLFCAKDHDGEFIVDEGNNNIFKARSQVYTDELGILCVDCTPIGRING